MNTIKTTLVTLLTITFFSACAGENQQSLKTPQSSEPIVINGHTLPPEPDPNINNSTLLGIDSNNNGVRDDVERKIYLEHDEEVTRQYLMMAAKQAIETLNAPNLIENAKDREKLIITEMAVEHICFVSMV